MVSSKPTADGADRTCALSSLWEFIVMSCNIVIVVIAGTFRYIIPRSKKSLENEVVLVTGSGRGLGRELALKFADKRAVVVLWDIDEIGIQKVKFEIEERGGTAHAYKCDVSDMDDVFSVGKRVQVEVGDVTIVVNNAGILQNVLFTDLDVRKIRKTLEINILAHFWVNKVFLPRMIQMKKGHIVATSSVAGLRGWLYLADYSAAKFAIHGMMESLEEEIRLLGLTEVINFTTACPMTIDTGMNHNPTSRCESFAPILKVDETAEAIVTGVQRNERMVTVPRYLLFLLLFLRIFPREVAQHIFDFLQYNMNPNSLRETVPPKSSETIIQNPPPC